MVIFNNHIPRGGIYAEMVDDLDIGKEIRDLGEVLLIAPARAVIGGIVAPVNAFFSPPIQDFHAVRLALESNQSGLVDAMVPFDLCCASLLCQKDGIGGPEIKDRLWTCEEIHIRVTVDDMIYFRIIVENIAA